MNDATRNFREDENRGRGFANPIELVEGFLDGDLAAATNTLTGATTALGTLIEWDSDGTSPASFRETAKQITLTNRTHRTASQDYWFLAAHINGEWRIIDVSCEVERGV